MESRYTDLRTLNKTFLIFDLFHTLTDFESKWSDMPSTSRFLGLDPEEWNRLLFHDTHDRLCGFEKDEFRILRGIVDKIDPSVDDARVESAVRHRKERFRQSLMNIPVQNVETLRRLRREGYKLGLLSNADVMEKASWPDSPLSGMFDSVVFSCDVGFAKPEREIFELSLHSLGCLPAEAVFIGDGGSDELEGARKLGLETILMSGIIEELWPERIPERRGWAGYEITAISDLANGGIMILPRDRSAARSLEERR